MVQVSLVAAVVAAIFSMVIGFVWYGPLFAKAWMKHVGLSEKDIGSGPGVGYALTMVAAFVMACTTSFLVKTIGVTDLVQGGLLGLILGIGYVATTFASNYIFAQKSLTLYLIDAGYQVLNVTAAGVITTMIV